jgi:hypothetical protein
MSSASGDSLSQGCMNDLPADLRDGSISLADYLLHSTQELKAITERVGRGETIERPTRDWMLLQVDFIVETVGNETLDLADGMRSNLLQLLLAIANLNEMIRRQTSLQL